MSSRGQRGLGARAAAPAAVRQRERRARAVEVEEVNQVDIAAIVTALDPGAGIALELLRRAHGSCFALSPTELQAKDPAVFRETERMFVVAVYALARGLFGKKNEASWAQQGAWTIDNDHDAGTDHKHADFLFALLRFSAVVLYRERGRSRVPGAIPSASF